MKNRYSIYKNLYGASACLLTACMVLTACDKEKEFTPAMSEAKLINSITFDVSATLPLAIGMDSTIVYSVEAPDDWKTVQLYGNQRMRVLHVCHRMGL